MIKIRKRDEIFHIKENLFEEYWHFSLGGPEGFHDPDDTMF